MEIREARPPDAESIRSVHYRSILELGRESYTESQVAAWARGCESADYARSIEDERTAFVVVERDAEISGFGTVTFAEPEAYEASVDAEITGVYVHPSVVRSGVGTRIYAELERRSRERNVEVLGLSASRNAVPFYEAHGYERVREYEHEFSSHEDTDVTGTVVEMKKEL